ncbi:MAG: sodium:proton antiporter [Clostridiales bacterium]|nr:sodium:proton antiporter [Clostridiales bacterium]
MNEFLICATIFLALTALLSMIRVIKGPSKGDRIIGINVIGTKTIVVMAIISSITKESYFMDVVLVYAMISFIGSYVIARELDCEKEGEGIND